MTQKQKQSLKNLIEYLEKDEEKNWEENDCPKTNHIYLDILILKKLI